MRRDNALIDGPHFEELFTLYRYFENMANKKEKETYFVPRMLIDNSADYELVDIENPFRFFYEILDSIIEEYRKTHFDFIIDPHINRDKISENDIIYISFIRTFASLNKEIGSALKQIAFLLTLKQRLGITIFISLPTGVIGRTNRKGKRGSPFAVSNPFKVDETFADPLLPQFSPIVQYKAFIQACNMLNIRAGSIVSLVALSIDSHLFRSFPELGFWWEAEPGDMVFCKPQAQDYREPSHTMERFNQLSQETERRFVKEPKSEEITVYLKDRQEYFIAPAKQTGSQKTITLANAFPDVLAGEADTYTWEDIAAINYSELTSCSRNTNHHAAL